MFKKLLLIILIMFLTACGITNSSGAPEPTATTIPDREDAIPENAQKVLPSTDLYPPIVHSPEWSQPIPMEGPVNTPGSEDSPFFSADGSLFFFFFTPVIHVPAEKQILDGVTGIWMMEKLGKAWSDPQKLLLSSDLALDGCPYFGENTLWFCSAREGNFKALDFYTANYQNGNWESIQNAGEELNVDIQIGELHLCNQEQTMFFHQQNPESGQLEIYTIEKTNIGWTEPFHLPEPVNGTGSSSHLYVSKDCTELWFTSQSRLGYPGPAIFRSIFSEGTWSEPEEIVSQFAGEPAFDPEGNLYFVHHFMGSDGEFIEVDIYVAKRKK